LEVRGMSEMAVVLGRPLCPLIKTACREEKCMFWIKEKKICAVVVIAKALSEISSIEQML